MSSDGGAPGKTSVGEAVPCFAVTTRSRLKGPWLFPVMFIASMRIRRQLAATGEVVRWASLVAGPSEFWTITLWRSRHDMQEFMRSGAHDDIMWLFSRWLKSFWLMRWRPGPGQMGSWDGLTMIPPARPAPAWFCPEGGVTPPAPDPNRAGTPAAPQSPPPAGSPAGASREERLAMALEHLPRLKAATGEGGAAEYDATPYARRRRAEVEGAGAVVVRVHTPLRATPEALWRLRRLRREAQARGDVLRSAVGLGKPGQVYLLAVWRDQAGAQRLLESPVLAGISKRWGRDCWANLWVPENEFGNWDGARLRRRAGRRRYGINVPGPALDAAEGADGDGAPEG